MKYPTYLRNHAVYPGREKALHTFLNATLENIGITDIIDGNYDEKIMPE